MSPMSRIEEPVAKAIRVAPLHNMRATSHPLATNATITKRMAKGPKTPKKPLAGCAGQDSLLSFTDDKWTETLFSALAVNPS